LKIQTSPSLHAARFRGLVDHRLHGKGHDADEDRQAGFALHQGLTGDGIVNAVGGVVGLGDDRIEGGAEQRRVHLVGDLLQAALQDRQRYRIDCHHSASSSYFLPAARIRRSDQVVQPGEIEHAATERRVRAIGDQIGVIVAGGGGDGADDPAGENHEAEAEAFKRRRR
jgi:hypothetical protein